jgi:hypothetical protein
MNQRMLKHRCPVADRLDQYIRDHQQLKGCRPERLYVSREQMNQLRGAVVENARMGDWNGIPIEVMR